jgi:hypothetical protein
MTLVHVVVEKNTRIVTVKYKPFSLIEENTVNKGWIKKSSLFFASFSVF